MRRFILLFVLLLTLCPLAAAQEGPSYVDSIVAVVNDDILTYRDVEQDLAEVVEQLRQTYQSPYFEQKWQEAINSHVDQWIEDRIFLAEAKERGIFIGEKEVEDEYEKYALKFFGSVENFRDHLIRNHSSPEEYKRKLTDDALINHLKSQVTTNAVFVLPNEMRDYYQKNKDKFLQPEKIETWQIVVRKKDEQFRAKELAATPAEAVEKIKELAAAGQAFDELAGKYSDGSDADKGGYVGFKARSGFHEKFAEPLFKMSPGDMTTVETDTFIFLLRVGGRTPEHPAAFTELIAESNATVHDIILGTLQQQKREKVEKEFLDSIRAKYNVQRND